MKIVSVALRSLAQGNVPLSHRFQQTHLLRSFSASPWTISDNSPDDSEQRIFGENPGRHSTKIDSYLEKLERLGNTQNRPSSVDGGSSRIMHDLEESIENTLSDGMDGKLKEAASFFEFDQDEIDKEDYSFRYDTNFYPGHTYTLKDLDLTKPASPPKGPIMGEFTVTTKEVLSQADFRNVRFLANFITEAGILIKRSQTGISAKAQRKVAREIKTARAFGLMPFTTMGTKSFVFGKTMETLDDDYAYRTKSADVQGDPDTEDIA